MRLIRPFLSWYRGPAPLGRPARMLVWGLLHPVRKLDGFVAGDDRGAKDTVLELVRSIGLNPVDVGPLARAQQLEQLAFLNIALNATANGSWSSGWRLIGAPTLVPVAA